MTAPLPAIALPSIVARMDLGRHILAASEPAATALLLAILGLLVASSVLFSKTADRLGIPVVLLFLVLGMLGGSEGIGGVHFDDYRLAVRIGTMALVLILFDGGLNTSVRAIRRVVWPATVLATLGVVATAGLVAVFSRLLGLTWPEALLLGAVVSSTDAAAVFAVLRGGRLRLQPRVGQTVEVESCINDPMAVILTTALIQALSADSVPPLPLAVLVPLQLLVGLGVGLLIGFGGLWILRRVRLSTAGLYPALTLSLAFASFGLATLALGSGFLSVYATAVVLGASSLPNRSSLARVHDALAWLSQISMFLMLGLLVFPSQLRPIAGIGLAVALFLAFVARPLAVGLCLWPFRYPLRETAFIGWIGLRGAVPIILATFPLLADVQGSHRIFNIVFFIVVVSALVPGATIRWLTRRFAFNTPEKPAPAAVLEINSIGPLGGRLSSFFIEPSVAVCGARLSEVEVPPQASVVLVIRGQRLIAPRGNTVIEAGDHVYIFFQPEDRPFIELLFGREEEVGGQG